jgi:hypothetical protein
MAMPTREMVSIGFITLSPAAAYPADPVATLETPKGSG